MCNLEKAAEPAEEEKPSKAAKPVKAEKSGVEVFVNGKSVGETGDLPSTSAMQRDGIRAYWIEKDIAFDAQQLKPGENAIELLSHANTWSQGVMYDCLRLELDDR